MSQGDLPVIQPAELDRTPSTASTTVLGVVLAAGTSERFGESNKLLAQIDGEPLISRAVEPFRESGLDGVIVVLGYEAAAVRRALAGDDVDFVVNPDYLEGQSTAVTAGVEAAKTRDADAVVFGLGDMPAVQARTIDLLRDAFDRGVAEIIPAAYEGQRGNPVLFSANHFEALAAIEGDTGGRSLIDESDDVACVETGDPGARYDIDRPADRPSDRGSGG